MEKKRINQGKIKHTITKVGDITFDSKTESKYHEHLIEKKARGEIKGFEMQVRFLLQEAFIIVDGQAITKSNPSFKSLKKKHKAQNIQDMEYVADFVIENNDESLEIVDIKGVMTADFALKKKLCQFRYPQYDFKVLAYYKGEWVDFYENEARKRAARKLKKELEKNNPNTILNKEKKSRTKRASKRKVN